MKEATLWRLQQAHQRQRREWDRIGRRLQRLTGKRSSDLLLNDPLLQPPLAGDPGQRMRMSGGQQAAISLDGNHANDEARRQPYRMDNSGGKLDLLVVGRQLLMHRLPGRRNVQLQQLQDLPSSQHRLSKEEEYVYIYPCSYHGMEMDSWSPSGLASEPYLVVDARFLAELLDELLMDATNHN
ncbi:uncharacterized protein LOC108097936 [Drosophila ficusphila]|uniref:uncharacterized protein LOC108097936 n=1 Tax=Drosophila ficusphila TaxID=30025 RepID=UPI0007E89A12|nr:uncharacterized protein LOC108097936 [Drosophila ficusphila]